MYDCFLHLSHVTSTLECRGLNLCNLLRNLAVFDQYINVGGESLPPELFEKKSSARNIFRKKVLRKVDVFDKYSFDEDDKMNCHHSFASTPICSTSRGGPLLTPIRAKLSKRLLKHTSTPRMCIWSQSRGWIQWEDRGAHTHAYQNTFVYILVLFLFLHNGSCSSYYFFFPKNVFTMFQSFPGAP